VYCFVGGRSENERDFDHATLPLLPTATIV
jgi:hypothetical protein